MVAPTQSKPDGPLARLVRLIMGEAPAGVNWPRYENPHQATGSAKGRQAKAGLGLLPILSQADAPLPAQMGFQDTATEAFFSIGHLHHSIWGWLSFVLLLVGLLLALIGYCFWSHQLRYGLMTAAERLSITVDHRLEFGWTLLPMGILLCIAVPSLSLIYALDELSTGSALIIQVVGRQWYWVYEYPSFAANLLEVDPLETEAELRDPLNREYPRLGLRLLDSTPLLLPLALELEFLTASEDVIHGFALPSAGIKMDAVPGRLNQVFSTFLRPGIFYGQCSELCGSGHGFMPITAQAVVESLFQLNLLEKAELLRSYLEGWLQHAALVGSEIPALNPNEPPFVWSPVLLEYLREQRTSADMGPARLYDVTLLGLTTSVPFDIYLRNSLSGVGFYLEYQRMVPLPGTEGGTWPVLQRIYCPEEATVASVTQTYLHLCMGDYFNPDLCRTCISPRSLVEMMSYLDLHRTPDMGPARAYQPVSEDSCVPRQTFTRSSTKGGFYLEYWRLEDFKPLANGDFSFPRYMEDDPYGAPKWPVPHIRYVDGLETLERVTAELGQMLMLDPLTPQNCKPPYAWPTWLLESLVGHDVSATLDMGRPRRPELLLNHPALSRENWGDLYVRSCANGGFYLEMWTMADLSDRWGDGATMPELAGRVWVNEEETLEALLKAWNKLMREIHDFRSPGGAAGGSTDSSAN